ncbi:MAG: hypothetical protein ACD_73C00060G0002 [uncultured bacterium]|nr:MAG: hypothetical protein ACD_73C00060G0002 [uncultured bacterium]
MHTIMKDPFRLYFPMGLIFGFWGMLVWILFFFQQMPYPGLNHADLMVMGFYTHFALGFLMTAIPRFTGTQTASQMEIGAGFLLISFSLLCFARFDLFSHWVHVIYFLEICFLIQYFLRRLSKRKSNPPPPFFFLFVGLFCAFTGGLVLLLQEHGLVSPVFNPKAFIYYGWTMAPMLGLGSVLVPKIIGYSQASILPLNHGANADLKKPYIIMGFLSLMFLVSQLGAFWPQVRGFVYLRQIVVTVVLVLFWTIYKMPPNKGYMAKGLWLSAWCLLIGTWFSVIDDAHRIHDIHLYFVGSISLMISCIATRVIVAHGNYPQTDETSSKFLLFAIIFILLAALTRVIAIWTQSYFVHLAVAAGIWILGYLLWTLKYGPKIFSMRDS